MLHSLPDVRVSGQDDSGWFSTTGTSGLRATYVVEVESEDNSDEILLDDVLEALRIATEKLQDLIIEHLRVRQMRKARAPLGLPPPDGRKL